MILDIYDLYENFDSKVVPYIHNGIIIDTSVIDIIIEGVVVSHIARKNSPELDKILRFLELLKMSNNWSRFYITPHILTEVCTHIRNNYNKRLDYKRVIEEVMPILKSMKEPSTIKNNEILDRIEINLPIVEVGDISIYITAENFANKKDNIAILANDSGLNSKYASIPHVLVMDYQNILLNSL